MKGALRRGHDPPQQMCLEISEQEAQTTDSQLLTVGDCGPLGERSKRGEWKASED